MKNNENVLTNINNLSSNIKNILNKNKQYKHNEEQIKCIKKVLIEHGDVPEKLLDWLISSVKENTIIEYKMMSNSKD